MMLTRSSDAPLDCDLAQVVEHSEDNRVFYVQYAHAHIHSVYQPKLLAAYPRLLAAAAAAKEPHRVRFLSF
jgi:arginyl-tRNA synthetase